ncbi:hypothetical protein Micbo1qcDRAFT_187923 [Microdochium bolleyi]|uniref:Rhodanese domain-containing protein n=1 Tax=Microdochium bolleyi TaxID=196109 RepID=A0A136JAM3_9PEZI|nr:hypothetical protein Micbo1qcDRAFT_187923 [Microdochium bolleyi]
MATISRPARAAPVPLQAPEPEAGDYFTDLQWQVYDALIDAVVPSIVVASGSDTTAAGSDADRHLVVSEEQCAAAYDDLVSTLKAPPTYDQFKEFLAARPLENPRFRKQIRRLLDSTPKSARKQLGGALNLMTRRTGSLLATGYWTPLHQQPVYIRERIIQSWITAWTPVWPLLASSFCTLARVGWAPTDPLFHKLSDYTDHIDDYVPGSEVDYRFLQFGPSLEPAVVETDIVIIGSGCGGSVAAKVLAEAGHRVVVVDKGYYFPPSHLPMAAEAGQHFLFEGAGAVQATNGAMSILAGSCWGGGGTVNWSASLEPQDFVREEWAASGGGVDGDEGGSQGLAFFREQEFQDSIDRVCDTMGVSAAHVRQNHGNRVLLEGAERLRWRGGKACPQNTGGNEHYCGRCSLGCGAGEKQGPAVNWLPAAQKAGAQFIEGFHATEVLFDEDGHSEEGAKRKAIGVIGQWTARDEDGFVHSPPGDRVQRLVRISAKKVIMSSGALNSPLLLMRSGLQNPHIGKNLHLHPAGMLTAAFHEDVKGWEGGILTSVISDFENLDGNGHGVKLETSSMLPHMVLFNLPWHSALQWKTDALKYRSMNSFIAMARDRDAGSVRADPGDASRPLVDYTISDLDRSHTLQGLVALAKLCYVQGAVEMWPAVPGVPTFKRSSPPPPTAATATATVAAADDDDDNDPLADPAFQSWLALLRAADNRPPRAQHASAHQMGTCRMSGSPETGVVDGKGRAWEAEDLYVADASVFPSASGVNPMITVMALADRIARGIAADWSV